MFHHVAVQYGLAITVTSCFCIIRIRVYHRRCHHDKQHGTEHLYASSVFLYLNYILGLSSQERDHATCSLVTFLWNEERQADWGTELEDDPAWDLEGDQVQRPGQQPCDLVSAWGSAFSLARHPGSGRSDLEEWGRGGDSNEGAGSWDRGTCSSRS